MTYDETILKWKIRVLFGFSVKFVLPSLILKKKKNIEYNIFTKSRESLNYFYIFITFDLELLLSISTLKLLWILEIHYFINWI